MVDCRGMSRPVWTPGSGHRVYFYEEAQEALTSALWDESDPYLVGLWERGKVFAFYNEARAAQRQEQTSTPQE